MFCWELMQIIIFSKFAAHSKSFQLMGACKQKHIAFLCHFLTKSPKTMNTPWVLGFNWKNLLLSPEQFQRLWDSEATYKKALFQISISASHFNGWFRLQSQLFTFMLGTEKSLPAPLPPGKKPTPQNQKLFICIKYSSWALSLFP